ncbi:ABC transporter substrate-binding protein [Endozoicomonas sp. SM1973]|uniref:ABC transporter substrate-binding protein n=1 Tax=Spartinivicinus marinus TaxID=2994442 RepID=A0A853I713_9GAMM|nr:ABC transporter substrate-binding protein [Spartinivicinus marinus]MCX4027090.1 ABC transporter substrate-binding protein [Spartinivicinus marinus]NYZ68569.1 ABC transporter substrate-binding protein [Spartinivicinus marinus]
MTTQACLSNFRIYWLAFIPKAACCILLALFFGYCFVAAADQKHIPIKIATNDWASQIILSYAIGSVLQNQGYTVKYQTISLKQQWGGLRLGHIHLQLEVWQFSMAKDFNRMVAKDVILDVGAHSAKTREDWWYPSYIKRLCPGLPDWQALNKCSQLFSTPESGNKGVYYTGPWISDEGIRIRVFKLNYRIISIDAASLNKRLINAVHNKQPIMLLNWTPNWTDNRVKGEFVEFPEFSQQCITDPSWGVNPTEINDCGAPKKGWLKKAANPNFPVNWPCAYQFIQNISFTNDMIAEAAALYEYDKFSYKESAIKWLEKYKASWQQWLPECMTIPKS